MINVNAVSSAQEKAVERVQGIQTGKLFVRINGTKLCEPHGTLHGVHPFLLKLLHLEDDDTAIVQRLTQPSEAKLVFTRKLRRQIRQRKIMAKRRWEALQEAIKVYDNGGLEAVGSHLSPVAYAASSALDRYLQQFQGLEQAYKQHVTSDILHLYALLEAESQYIKGWCKREEANYRDQRSLTKLLHQLNSFALQLESETSGQVRMWRLPTSDEQRMRCVKAATENIKKRFFSSPTQSLEVLEVYKIDNRVLLDSFQRYTSSLAKKKADIKITGLFCSVPAESFERCVVYGMHTASSGVDTEPRFLDSQGAEVKVFNRSVLLPGQEDAPGTSNVFRARSKVINGTPLQFPRRFSRYSTLEEVRTASIAPETPVEGQPQPVQYLGLCRVAMGKTLRVKDSADATFPGDPSVGVLHFSNQEEYLVRYPDAVVPEFIIQFRIKTPSTPLSVEFSDSIIPVSLASSTSCVAFDDFENFIYSPTFDNPASTISAFPLSRPPSDRQCSFFTPNESPASSSPVSLGSQQQNSELLAKKTGERLVISPDTVLANCARQRAQLRENLQRLEKLFWSRAPELWEEEGIRIGVKIHCGNHDEVQPKTQQLRGELDIMEELARQTPKTRLKRPPSSANQRR